MERNKASLAKKASRVWHEKPEDRRESLTG